MSISKGDASIEKTFYEEIPSSIIVYKILEKNFHNRNDLYNY